MRSRPGGIQITGEVTTWITKQGLEEDRSLPVTQEFAGSSPVGPARAFITNALTSSGAEVSGHRPITPKPPDSSALIILSHGSAALNYQCFVSIPVGSQEETPQNAVACTESICSESRRMEG